MQLALPLYQRTPSTSILARNGFERRFFEPGPDVRGAAEPLLQPAVAGVADHRGVEARAGHDREALAVEASDVELAVARRAGRSTTACSMSLGMPRLVANRFAVPAGMIASVTSEPASTSTQRWTIPSPPHDEDELRASATARRTCAGALRLFGTSHQNGSVDALGLEDATELRQPAAERLAGVGDDRNLHASPPWRLS